MRQTRSARIRGKNAQGGRVDETGKAMVEFARATSGFGRARGEIDNMLFMHVIT